MYYFHFQLGSLVGGGTSQSLGTRLWVPVLLNWKVICNAHCPCVCACVCVWCVCVLKNYRAFLLAHLINCDRIFLCVIMMYLVSYNSVQNGLVYFYMSVHIHVCYVMLYTETKLSPVSSPLTREWPSIVARGRTIPLKFEQYSGLTQYLVSVAGVEEENTAIYYKLITTPN